jgi:hypothetical protein
MVDGHLAVGCVGGIDADEGSGVLAGSNVIDNQSALQTRTATHAQRPLKAPTAASTVPGRVIPSPTLSEAPQGRFNAILRRWPFVSLLP